MSTKSSAKKPQIFRKKSLLEDLTSPQAKHVYEPADHSAQIHRVNRIQGQINGIRKMIETRAYCPKILIQISAVRAALRSLETELLQSHLEHCVSEAFEAGDKKHTEKKISELLTVFRRG